MKKLLVVLIAVLMLAACKPTEDELISSFESSKKTFQKYTSRLNRINDSLVNKYGEDIINYDATINEEVRAKADPYNLNSRLFDSSVVYHSIRLQFIESLEEKYRLLPDEYKKDHSLY